MCPNDMQASISPGERAYYSEIGEDYYITAMSKQYAPHPNWLEEFTLDETLDILRDIALVHACKAGPFAADLLELLENRNWRGLVDFNVDYARGSEMDLYHLRQSLGLFQKLEQLPLGVDKEAAGWSGFLEAEQRCRLTNARLTDPFLQWKFKNPLIPAVIHTAMKKIEQILGPVPRLDELNIAYGPGASVGVKAAKSSARWKLHSPIRCSANMATVIQQALESTPLITEQHRVANSGSLLYAVEDHLDRVSIVVEIVMGRLSFVRKNALVFRPIVVEPPFNTLFQKGYGSHIRGRLRSVGLDLDRQADVNKVLARSASVSGRLATEDLRMASDTWAREAVYLLTPPLWYEALDAVRTRTLEYKGKQITLEKFSSMGNGFTFELESLLFYSIAWACCAVLKLPTNEVSSFGDDVILPVEGVTLFEDLMEHLGLEINRKKSFSTGRFRESCGGDYVNGIDIRPYYQKDLVSGQTLFALHNYYVRTLQPEMAELVLKRIHPSLLLWGPDGYGDGHLVGSWADSARPPRTKLRANGYSGVTFETFALSKRVCKHTCRKGDRVLPAYSIYVAGKHDPLSYLDGDTEPNDVRSALPPSHYVVRGDEGYKRISIYTYATGVLCRF